MNRQRLVLIRGIPGSGKSTLAERLANEVRSHGGTAVVYENDQFHMVDGVYQFDVSKVGEAAATCLAKTITALADDKYGVVYVANTFTRVWEMSPYFAVASALGISTKVHELVPKTVEEAQQMAKRNVHNVPLATIGQMLLQWEPLI